MRVADIRGAEIDAETRPGAFCDRGDGRAREYAQAVRVSRARIG
jgi:hypothetical protein